MSKNKRGNGHHHLTLSDRIYIESELNIGSTFKSIADFLGKDPSTISKEVRLHREFSDPYKLRYLSCLDCIYKSGCEKFDELADSPHYRYISLSRNCDRFDPFSCAKHRKHPYVCNGCIERKCKKNKLYYTASKAQNPDRCSASVSLISKAMSAS